jgi:sortase A
LYLYYNHVERRQKKIEYNPPRQIEFGKGKLLARRRSVEDLTVEELRHLLIEKRRAERQRRLEKFRRSGRVVLVEPHPGRSAFEAVGAQAVDTLPEIEDTPRSRRKRTWIDHLLLVIEITAVLGLAFVLFNGVSLIRNLNQEFSAVLEQPTLTPTALIQAVVLPSGHTPPNLPDGGRFNEAEIPEHLRPLAQTLANRPIPTPSPEQAIRIQIPAIGVDAPVVQGDGEEQLKKGVGQHIGTSNPGQKGNLVLSAHNDIFGEIFRELDKLQKGDEIILFTSQRTYVYVVQQTQIVEPTRVEVMAPTQEPAVTLISCYPYMVNNKRIVVTADLLERR